MADKSSRFHVLPMEKEPLLFSRALCIRTRPVLRTATTMTRGFLFSGGEEGGGGVDGCAASSTMRMCVMYDSATMQAWISGVRRGLQTKPHTLSVLIELGEAALNHSTLLILEALRSRHGCAWRLSGGHRSPAAAILHGRVRRNARLRAIHAVQVVCRIGSLPT